MTVRIIHSLVPIILVILYVRGETIQDVQRVLDDYLSPAKYNKLIRGVLDQRKVVEVNLTFRLVSLARVNEVEETVEAIGVLYIRWIDERLIWNPADYNDTKLVHAFQNEMWKPEVVLSNPATVVSVLGNDRIMAAVYHNGTVLWRDGEHFKFYCSLDVTTYPWDRQKCSLKFMVWGYYSDEVKLMTPTEDIDIRYYFGSGAWELESTKATMEGTIIPTVLFTINIRRFPEFAVVNVLVPVLTLTVLNLFAFLIPPESGEKLSYCITVFLAFAVFLTIIADHLPGNSNNMALLCYFLMFVLLLSTFICVSAVISVAFYHMAESGEPPQWLRRTVSQLKSKRAPTASQHVVTSNGASEEFNRYHRESVGTSADNLDKNTWHDLSRFVNSLSCAVIITVLFVCHHYNIIGSYTTCK